MNAPEGQDISVGSTVLIALIGRMQELAVPAGLEVVKPMKTARAVRRIAHALLELLAIALGLARLLGEHAGVMSMG
jgi:hypothetical protein